MKLNTYILTYIVKNVNTQTRDCSFSTPENSFFKIGISKYLKTKSDF